MVFICGIISFFTTLIYFDNSIFVYFDFFGTESPQSIHEIIFSNLKDDIEARHNKSIEDIKSRIEIQKDRDSLEYKILPHPDGMMKYVTCLIYLPEDDSHQHLGTNIYEEVEDGKYTGTAGKSGGYNDFSKRKFNIVRKCPFKPNSMASFAVSKEKSWHGVDEMKEKYTRNCIQIFFCSKKGTK